VLEKQVSGIFPTPCHDLTADDAMPWLTRRITDFFDSRMSAQGMPAFMLTSPVSPARVQRCPVEPAAPPRLPFD